MFHKNTKETVMQCSSVLKRLIETVRWDGHENAENHSRTLDGEKNRTHRRE